MKSAFEGRWFTRAVQGAMLIGLATALVFIWARGTHQTQAAPGPINVLTVDCTPFVTPGISSIGLPTNTMGMAIQAVDQGGEFNVTEVTPATFRAMTTAQLSGYDLFAVNNHPVRLGDGCVVGAGSGLGTTWQGVIGINSGGRVMLTSHDAPRYKMTYTNPPGNCCLGMNPGPGAEPFGADDLVRQAALWAGGGSQTGLLIFNDAPPFVGGIGWDNPELNLPAAWGISDLNQNTGGLFMDGGYTDILPAFAAHPIYAGLSDARFGVNSISSFAANIADTSFHSVFGSYNAAIFTPTEVVVNAGVIDVGGYGCCAFNPAVGPNGTPITLIRDEGAAPPPTPTPTPTPSPTATPVPSPTPTPMAVGGIVELLSAPSDAAPRQTGASSSSGLPWVALAAGIAALGFGGVAGVWHIRRRRVE